MIFLKSDNSSAVQGSDFVDKSTFFGSLMSPILLNEFTEKLGGCQISGYFR